MVSITYYQQTFHILHIVHPSKREVRPKGPAGKLIVPTTFLSSHMNRSMRLGKTTILKIAQVQRSTPAEPIGHDRVALLSLLGHHTSPVWRRETTN